MPDNDFESWFDSWAEGVQRAACADAARPDFDWAIGGEDPDEGGHVAAEYAIEPVRGGCARSITDHLPCAIEDLPDFRDEARINA